jgi:hypothetical protein
VPQQGVDLVQAGFGVAGERPRDGRRATIAFIEEPHLFQAAKDHRPDVGFDDQTAAMSNPLTFTASPLAFAIARAAARRSAWFIASPRPPALVAHLLGGRLEPGQVAGILRPRQAQQLGLEHGPALPQRSLPLVEPRRHRFGHGPLARRSI